MAAASLGELTISALGTATVLGNAQLAAAGTHPTAVVDRSRRRPRGRPGHRRRQRADGAGDGRRRDAGRGTAADAENRRRRLEELLAELDALVGLDAVKTEVRHQTQVLRIQALRGLDGLAQPRPDPPPRVRRQSRAPARPPSPGWSPGSTAPSALLPKGHLVECDRSELVAGYLGQTALKTAEVIDARARRRAVHRRGVRAGRRRVRRRGDRHAGEGDGGPPRRAARDRRRLPGADGGVHHVEPRAREPLPAHAEFDDYSDDELVEIFARIASRRRLHPDRRTRSTALRGHPARRRRATRGSATAGSCATCSSRRSCARRGGCATSPTPTSTSCASCAPRTSSWCPTPRSPA